MIATTWMLMIGLAVFVILVGLIVGIVSFVTAKNRRDE